jgi:hypothetical protein
VDADCAPNQVCDAGTCIDLQFSCVDDSECLAGEVCIEGACVGGVVVDACASPIRIDAPGDYAGSTDGAGALYTGTCGGSGGEVAFELAAGLGEVCLTTSGVDFDSVLHTRSVCGDASTELACNDDGVALAPLSRLSANVGPDAGVFVLVDSFFSGSRDAFTLNVAAGPCAEPPLGCEVDADCSPGLVCSGGACVAPQCIENADCSAGYRCEASLCVDAVCADDVDCFVGEVCFDGICRADVGPNACAAPTPIDAVGVYQGNTSQGSSLIEGTCGTSGGREVAFAVSSALGTVCASTFGTRFDTVLRVRTVCDDATSEVACADDLVAGEYSSRVQLDASDAARFLFVDGYDAQDFGAFTLTITEGACPELAACAVTADCADGTFCFNGTCLPPLCVADADCAAYEACTEGRCAARACEVDADCGGGLCDFGRCGPAECAADDDCAANETCAAGRCQQRACAADLDCATGQRCVDGGCVIPSCEASADCPLPFVCERFSCESQACEATADCRAGAVCLAGLCVESQCQLDDDCPAPDGCLDGVCQPRGCQADATCGDGFICVDNLCVFSECTTSADCLGADVCEVSRCVAPPPCADDAACLDGQLCIEAACVDAPNGDACDGVTPIDGLGQYVGTLAGAPELRAGTCGGAGGERAFELSAGLGVVCVSTVGTGFDTVLYARQACDLLGGEVGCSDDAVDAQSELTLDTTAAPLFVFVDAYSSGVDADFVLTVTAGACGVPPGCTVDADCAQGEVCASVDGQPGECIPVPPECVADADCAVGQICVIDTCVDGPNACDVATPIDAVGVFAGSTARGSVVNSGDCGGGGPEVVFALPAGLGTVCATTEGSAFDTVLYARTACGDSETETACSDDDLEALTSRVTVPAAEGDRFLFVDGFDIAEVGDFTLTLTSGACACRSDADCGENERCLEGACVAVPDGGCLIDADCQQGETCANNGCLPPVAACDRVEVLTLAPAISVQGTTAGLGPSNVSASCGGGNASERVYALTLTAHSVVNARVQGFDTVLSVQGTCGDASTEIACNDDVNDGDLTSALADLRLAPGTWYFVVDGFRANSGDFVLDLTVRADCPDGVAGTYCGDRDLGQTVSKKYSCEGGVYAPGPGCLWTCVDGACQAPPAEAGTCADPIRLPAESTTVLGNTLRGLSVLRSFCGGGERERVYRLDLQRRSLVTLTSTGFDTVLYIQGECGNEASQNGCNNDATPPGNGGSRMGRVLPAGTWYVVVDGRGQAGQYQLDVVISPL